MQAWHAARRLAADGGVRAVEAADEDEIRARLARDPWASAGLLRIGTIEPAGAGAGTGRGIQHGDQHSSSVQNHVATRARCGMSEHSPDRMAMHKYSSGRTAAC